MAKPNPKVTTHYLFLERYEHEHGPEGIAEIRSEVVRLKNEARARGEEPHLPTIRRHTYVKYGMKGWNEERDLRLQVLEEQKWAVLNLLSKREIDRYAALSAVYERKFADAQDKWLTLNFKRAWKKVEPNPDEPPLTDKQIEDAAYARKVRMHRRAMKLSEFRKALANLSDSGRPNVEDITWVYHQLPKYFGVKFKRHADGHVRLTTKHIEGAPSKGAVIVLRRAMEDPDDFYKSVIEIVKAQARKHDEKPTATVEGEEGEETKETVVDDDPGLLDLLG